METAKEKSINAFNKQASTYDLDRKGEHARTLYPALLSKLAELPFRTILDVGCGTGAVLKQVIEWDEKINAFGVDISENMLEEAWQKVRGEASLILADSEYLPFEDGFFDIVYCNDSFHHYPKPEKVLMEINRVLKKDGNFVMCDVWQPAAVRSVMNFFFRFSDEGDVKMYSEKELRTMMEPYFREVTWEKISGSGYMATGRK